MVIEDIFKRIFNRILIKKKKQKLGKGHITWWRDNKYYEIITIITAEMKERR